MLPVVCVRNQPSAPLGIIEDVLRERDLSYLYCDAWSSEVWPEPRDLSALIVLGGEMNVDALDRHRFLSKARDLVRATMDHGLPVLGVCLGAQMLARALGAEVNPSPVREIGFGHVFPTAAGEKDPVLSGFTEDVPVFQWHEDAFELPAGAELLHTGAEVPNQSFRAGRAYGVQFHFEVTMSEIVAWADETDPDELADVWGTTPDLLIEDARRNLARQQKAGREATSHFLEALSD